jgi:hypothetical protein
MKIFGDLGSGNCLKVKYTAADPNLELVAFLEVQEVDDLGRQPSGEIVAPLLDFHRSLPDSTHVHLGGAVPSVNVVL